MKRLILFVGVYDTLDLFTYELEREFQNLGYETMLFDSRKMEESLIELAQFVQQPVKAVITFNNLGFNMELAEGKNIWEELQIPCVNILMDHPFCYRKALLEAPSNAVVLCTDRNHMRYLQRFYPNIPIVGYLPHAGKETGGVPKSIADRSMDVMYAGNLSRSFAENIMPDFSKYTEFDARKLCEKAYHRLIDQPTLTTEAALEQCLCELGLELTEDQLNEIISDLHVVDLYAVSYYREKTVRSIAEAGISLTLYGAGWDSCEWIDLPNVSYGGKIPAEQVVQKMADTKIVLSTMTWFKDGTHDRVFNGMLAGAVTVSDQSGYMLEEFCGSVGADGEDEREMILFDLEQMEQLPQMVRELLEDPDLAQRIADRGYEHARKGHTWRARAEELERDLLAEF